MNPETRGKNGLPGRSADDCKWDVGSPFGSL